MMEKRNELNKKHLLQKYENRIENKREHRFKIVQEIEDLEVIEKALMDELGRTTQKRDERRQKINEINHSFYKTGIFNSKKHLEGDESFDETFFESIKNKNKQKEETKSKKDIENEQINNIENDQSN